MKLEDDQIIEAMRNAGIPHKFRDPKHSLKVYGELGDKLLEWRKAGVRNLFLVGGDPVVFYAFCTLARNLLLDGVATKLIGLPDLVESIGDPEYRDELDRIQALFLAGFYKEGMTGKPFSTDVGDRIEWFLSRRLQSECSTFFHSTNDPHACFWWSPQLLKSIERSLDDGPMIVECVT